MKIRNFILKQSKIRGKLGYCIKEYIIFYFSLKLFHFLFFYIPLLLPVHVKILNHLHHLHLEHLQYGFFYLECYLQQQVQDNSRPNQTTCLYLFDFGLTQN